MEWKRRQSEELKAKGQDKEGHDRRSKGEASLEAARKVAATRVEEATRGLLQEREDSAAKARAAELAEKSAKEAHDKEQKRAEIYAINAIKRHVLPAVRSGCIDVTTTPTSSIITIRKLCSKLILRSERGVNLNPNFE